MSKNKWRQHLALPYAIKVSKLQWNLNGLQPMSQNKWQQHLGLPYAIKVSEQMIMELKWLAPNVTKQMVATSGIAICHQG